MFLQKLTCNLETFAMKFLILSIYLFLMFIVLRSYNKYSLLTNMFIDFYVSFPLSFSSLLMYLLSIIFIHNIILHILFLTEHL